MNVKQATAQYRGGTYRWFTDDNFTGDLLPFLRGFGVSSVSDAEMIPADSVGEGREALQINS